MSANRPPSWQVPIPNFGYTSSSGGFPNGAHGNSCGVRSGALLHFAVKVVIDPDGGAHFGILSVKLKHHDAHEAFTADEEVSPAGGHGIVEKVVAARRPSTARPPRNPISGRQLVHHRENVLGVASESIELPDGEHVAFAEMVEAGIEMGSGRGRAAHAMVGVDAVRPGFLKRVERKLRVLIGGADSRISDNRHCCSHVSIVFETGGRRIFWPSSQDTSR